MISDEEDDTHYCLKCHSTIRGLDNYVTHRKTKCGKTTTQQPEVQAAPLKADDFFSSLELQSSSKKAAAPPAPAGGKVFSGVFTRSKTSAVIHSKETKEAKEYEESESESDEYDCDDEDSEFEDDDDVPPRSFTGGKWKPSSSPVEWLDWSAPPPPTHTGGKWKAKPPPGSFPPPEHTGSKWKPSYHHPSSSPPPPHFTGSKWTASKAKEEDDIPPPNHTKGKWKPAGLYEEPSTSKAEQPPLSYTRGKWKPAEPPAPPQLAGKWSTRKLIVDGDLAPFRKSSGIVQYWCRPCNRRLASKIVYDRHLKSELHFKRTLQDRELEEVGIFHRPGRREMANSAVAIEQREATAVVGKTGGRLRKRLFFHCDTCRSKVNSSKIGKHLISHYHCRKSDISLPAARQLVLDNIHSIVLQSPFQCGTCKFYCNTQEVFLDHWRSARHNSNASGQGFFWCLFCKHRVATSELMHNHLLSKDHAEVISVINKSVPIVIKRIIPIKCSACDSRFLYNKQLLKHCERTGHPRAPSCSDDYQSRHTCKHCGQVFKSHVASQRHQMKAHNISVYICSLCKVEFGSKDEAVTHRRSSQHRCKVLKAKERSGKSCQYCQEKFLDMVELKEHLRTKHEEHNHCCPLCGQSFTIPQELTVHLRNKACSFSGQPQGSNSCEQCPFTTDSASEILFHRALHRDPVSEPSEAKVVSKYRCPVCEKVFDKLSLRCHLRVHTKERPFVCAVCGAGFVRKNNWTLHVKIHEKKHGDKRGGVEGEFGGRPFLCSTCGDRFKKRQTLQQHMTRHTGKLFECNKPDCIFTARSQSELNAHQLTHSANKPFSCVKCDYSGKTKSQLLRHLSVHEKERKHQCPHCSFSARMSSHLKRHLRLHTGAKPFVCPHCDYRCNNLENLRKHILSTGRHPGKFVYECNFCRKDFRTNLSKDFKMHLTQSHPDRFLSGLDATTYVSSVYEAENDSTHIVGDTSSSATNLKERALNDQDVIIPIPSASMTNNIGSAVLLTSVTTQEPRAREDLFPMVIVSQDVVCVENPSETWNIGGSYDVDETGSLVPFHAEGETLFTEHFQ